MNKLVSIIVPSLNRKKKLFQCLKSLSEINYHNNEILVIDNGSEKRIIDMIKKEFPKIKLIQLFENKGAVGARNIGIKNAKGSYLCFVDSDNVVDQNFLTELVYLAESDPKIGFVGPKMYYLNNKKKIWFAGVKLNLITSKPTYYSNQMDRGQFDQVREIEHIPNVWLVKREVVNKIGLMDEIFVMTYGESDWAMRAKKVGYKIMFCPSSYVYHNVSVIRNSESAILLRANPYRVYYFARNRAIFMKKFASKINFLIFLLIFNNIYLFVHFYIFIKNKRYDLIKHYLKGYFDGLKLINKIEKYN